MSIPAHLLGKYAILLFDSKGLISSLIRWQTRGTVSHAAILLPDGNVLESMQGDGVRTRSCADVDWSTAQAFDVVGMSDSRWDAAMKWIGSPNGAKMGDGYDYLAVFRFITRHRQPPNNRWFCSELVFEALQSVGVNLLERIPASQVTPFDILTSPLLSPIKP